MDLKLWSPLLDIDKDWHFEFPRLIREAGPFRPSVDVVRTDGHLVFTAELPGLTPDDVDVSLVGDILTIKGEKSEERDVKEEDRFLHERSFGAFSRRIAVPEGVSADGIDAQFADGILTVNVELPVEKKVEPRRIPIETTTGS